MRKRMMLLLAALSMTALVAGGCANKEAVKTEEPAAATVKVEQLKPAQQPGAKSEEPAAPVENRVAEAIKPAEAQTGKAVEEVSAFEPIYFDFDSSDLRQDARNTLTKNAEMLLKSKPATRIKIEGNCDERGSAEYNLALGERRAKSAMQYLITLGVQPERLSIISYGKEKPAVMGDDEAAWAKNRRDEFVIEK
ncbi:MAG: peptidoglycan-associated lipoprotein Pal [Desulfobacteraceae bacterium]|nr:peptidoglycan-associated lipoprotein Pal [Desulfobacteraceae bacterium]